LLTCLTCAECAAAAGAFKQCVCHVCTRAWGHGAATSLHAASENTVVSWLYCTEVNAVHLTVCVPQLGRQVAT
jgi:hypothetical protein